MNTNTSFMHRLLGLPRPTAVADIRANAWAPGPASRGSPQRHYRDSLGQTAARQAGRNRWPA